jgi:hypothetical protein
MSAAPLGYRQTISAQRAVSWRARASVVRTSALSGSWRCPTHATRGISELFSASPDPGHGGPGPSPWAFVWHLPARMGLGSPIARFKSFRMERCRLAAPNLGAGCAPLEPLSGRAARRYKNQWPTRSERGVAEPRRWLDYSERPSRKRRRHGQQARANDQPKTSRWNYLVARNGGCFPLSCGSFSAALKEIECGPIKGIPLPHSSIPHSSIPHSGDRPAHNTVLTLFWRRKTAGGCRT